MSDLRCVIVPLDGSEFAERALPHALGWCTALGLPARLLSVPQPRAVDFEERGGGQAIVQRLESPFSPATGDPAARTAFFESRAAVLDEDWPVERVRPHKGGRGTGSPGAPSASPPRPVRCCGWPCEPSAG